MSITFILILDIFWNFLYFCDFSFHFSFHLKVSYILDFKNLKSALRPNPDCKFEIILHRMTEVTLTLSLAITLKPISKWDPR